MPRPTDSRPFGSRAPESTDVPSRRRRPRRRRAARSRRPRRARLLRIAAAIAAFLSTAADSANAAPAFVFTEIHYQPPGDPDLELSLTELAERTGAPHPSVHREIERAELAGLVTSRKVGNTRLVSARVASPYYAGLADVLARAFGVPAILATALRELRGIEDAYVFGSWAARHAGTPGERPVADIDVLVLGVPDRDG